MTQSDEDLQWPEAKKPKREVFASGNPDDYAPQRSSPVIPPTPQSGTRQRAVNVNGSMGGTQNPSMLRGSCMDDLIDPVMVGYSLLI